MLRTTSPVLALVVLTLTSPFQLVDAQQDDHRPGGKGTIWVGTSDLKDSKSKITIRQESDGGWTVDGPSPASWKGSWKKIEESGRWLLVSPTPNDKKYSFVIFLVAVLDGGTGHNVLFLSNPDGQFERFNGSWKKAK